MSTDIDWNEVRDRFGPKKGGRADFTAMVNGSRTTELADKIAEFGKAIDRDGYEFWLDNHPKFRDAALEAAYRYLNVNKGQIALTYNTSMGLAQVLGGVHMRPGQEFLISANEHAATTETLRFRARRDGAGFRQVRLYRDSRTVSSGEITQNLLNELQPSTRVLSLAWVYSSDGVTLPIAKIAKLVSEENRRRSSDNQLLFVVDGVHGFGVRPDNFKELGCDFLIAGCHKMLYGPRGTAVICGKTESWTQVVPLVARLSSADFFPGSDHSPGGVKAYENLWALGPAFRFHLELGKSRIFERIDFLASKLKQGLSKIPRVTVRTPASLDLSSAIVCFDLDGWPAKEAVDELMKQGIIASESAWDFHEARTHVRLSVSLSVDNCDIDAAIKAIGELPSK